MDISSIILSFFSDSSCIDDSVFKEFSLVLITNFLFEDFTFEFFDVIFSFVLFNWLLFDDIFGSVFKWDVWELLSVSGIEFVSCFDSFEDVSRFILSRICFNVFAIAGLKSSIFL